MTLIVCKDRQEVLDATGHVLVTGGPGSGKTTIALAKAAKRIEAGLSPGQSVLFLSFSRAAVARVLEAIERERLPKEVRRALSIQTFHSFFWQVLRAYGYLLGAPRTLRLLLPHDERALRDGANEESTEWALERERLFREDGHVAFDLFAAKALQLLRDSTRIRHIFSSCHPLLIVDEAQDTAEDQWQAVRLLADKSQLVCLADLDQQIYDFRPGVSAKRVTEIMEALVPLRVDLEAQNHRSPDSEIVAFGNDILLNTPRGAKYKGVSRFQLLPRREQRDATIRKSVGIASQLVEKTVGAKPENMAVLASWGRGVTIITKALTGDGATNRIPHRVLLDEAPVLLASRLIAFLMEPRDSGRSELSHLADGLDLTASLFRSKGGVASLKQATSLIAQAAKARAGETPKANSVAYKLLEIIRKIGGHSFSGDPRKDWLDARKYLAGTGKGVWSDVSGYAEQLIAFQRGQHIASALAELWQTRGTYAGARPALDAALAQDQLLSGGNDLRGIHVMTLHKAKGKEFDAVIIVDDSNNCPLIYCKERAPHPRSRKLLRVGITRAKHHVLLLTDVRAPSLLLEGHRL